MGFRCSINERQNLTQQTNHAHVRHTTHIQVTPASHSPVTDIYYKCICTLGNNNYFIDYARFHQQLTTDNARFSTYLQQIFGITYK
jgi:hypothetical protein